MARKKSKNLVKAVNLHKFRPKHRFFAFFLIFLILIFSYFKCLVTPLILASIETQLGSYSARAINYAISDTITQNVSYGDLITIVKDENENVAYMEANAVRINLLSKTISRAVMANFLELAKIPIKISLGAFSGITALAGLGPKIPFSVSPFGEVNSSFLSSFESAGINQTYHKIYLVISINVNVVLPGKKLAISSSSEVLLCESVIVGEIPEVYLNSSNLTDMLNLIPESFGG